MLHHDGYYHKQSEKALGKQICEYVKNYNRGRFYGREAKNRKEKNRIKVDRQEEQQEAPDKQLESTD